jgi:lactobin A/cerein 7B family class IIb bacteriocin
MKANFGKPLTKKEMKNIQGGKYPGCAMVGQAGVAYANGCCTGLIACGGPTGLLCEPAAQCA